MKIVSKVRDLREILSEHIKNKPLGFVPTMGALHEGHLSLVKKSIAQNEFTLCSIFVNPAQFNNAKDLENYPNPISEDLKLLEEVGCDFVFTPTNDEIYPKGLITNSYEFGTLANVMEGAKRPGHFEGVAMAVSRLFDLVKPQKAYFGEKDFQQLAIIQSLVKQDSLPIEIVSCAIAREKNGLAMSSRNLRLSNKHKKAAPKIYERLQKAASLVGSSSIEQVKLAIENSFLNDPNLNLEYFEISNPVTLEASKKWSDSKTHIACIAVFAGEIRLIDNILFRIN